MRLSIFDGRDDAPSYHLLAAIEVTVNDKSFVVTKTRNGAYFEYIAWEQYNDHNEWSYVGNDRLGRVSEFTDTSGRLVTLWTARESDAYHAIVTAFPHITFLETDTSAGIVHEPA